MCRTVTRQSQLRTDARPSVGRTAESESAQNFQIYQTEIEERLSGTVSSTAIVADSALLSEDHEADVLIKQLASKSGYERVREFYLHKYYRNLP